MVFWSLLDLLFPETFDFHIGYTKHGTKHVCVSKPNPLSLHKRLIPQIDSHTLAPTKEIPSIQISGNAEKFLPQHRSLLNGAGDLSQTYWDPAHQLLLLPPSVSPLGPSAMSDVFQYMLYC